MRGLLIVGSIMLLAHPAYAEGMTAAEGHAVMAECDYATSQLASRSRELALELFDARLEIEALKRALAQVPPPGLGAEKKD